LSKEDIWQIHATSLECLEKIGMRIHSRRGLTLLKDGGAKVDFTNKTALLPTSLVKKALTMCSPVLTLAGRDGSPSLRVGGGRVTWGACAYPTEVLDWRTGDYRNARLTDLEELAMLTDQLDNMGFLQPSCCPADVPRDKVDRYQWKVGFLKCRKPVLSQCHDRKGFDDMLAMASLVAGDVNRFREHPFVILVCGIRSPFAVSEEISELIIAGAEYGIPLDIYSGPMGGATAPATLASVLVQTNAEILGGIVLAKMVNPDVPILYTTFSRIFDMKSGNISLGGPEFGLLQSAAAQMAAYYGLPSGGGGLLADSKSLDVQMGFEKMGTALMPALAGVNFISGAATLADEMVLSLESCVLEDEIIEYVQRVLRGIELSEERLGWEVMHKVGPQGHFLEEPHTLKFFREETWFPTLTDRKSYSRWMEDGAPDIRSRGKAAVAEKLESFRPLSLPEGIEEKMDAIINA